MLHFSRSDWDRLPWVDQQMYLEQLDGWVADERSAWAAQFAAAGSEPPERAKPEPDGHVSSDDALAADGFHIENA